MLTGFVLIPHSLGVIGLYTVGRYRTKVLVGFGAAKEIFIYHLFSCATVTTQEYGFQLTQLPMKWHLMN